MYFFEKSISFELIALVESVCQASSCLFCFCLAILSLVEAVIPFINSAVSRPDASPPIAFEEELEVVELVPIRLFIEYIKSLPILKFL